MGMFSYDQKTKSLVAHSADSLDTKFTMKLVTGISNGSEGFTNIEVRFDHMPNFVAHYKWEDEEDIEDLLDFPETFADPKLLRKLFRGFRKSKVARETFFSENSCSKLVSC